jgi:hypothetical protein
MMYQQSIGMYDWQRILEAIETVGWIAVLGMGLFLLIRASSKVNKQHKQIMIILFVAWALASLSQAGLRLYSYYDSERKIIKESIEMQEKQFGN